MAPKHLDELRTAIRGVGLRATPSRLAVLELLRTTDAPMSHGEVADRLAAQPWDRATIYRNLTDLAEAKLVRRSDVGDHVWRFEARRATQGEAHEVQHPHFVCTDCGTVECMPELELVAKKARAPRAVKQRQVEIHVRGVCDACS